MLTLLIAFIFTFRATIIYDFFILNFENILLLSALNKTSNEILISGMLIQPIYLCDGAFITLNFTAQIL